MTARSIFVSYARRHQGEVDDLIKYLSDAELDVWYDRNIRTGDFRDWIASAISESRAMIVILTRESVGSGSSGWIEREIDMARDSGIGNLILPCFIGDFVAPPELDEKIRFLQTVSVSSIRDLPFNTQFRQHVQYLKDVIGGKVAQMRPQFGTAGAVTPTDWFTTDPRPTSADIALALATTLLEYRPIDIVLDTAREIENAIEERLGKKTEAERAADIRELSAQTATERFARIEADRAVLPANDGSAQLAVVRFKDRNWRGAMLRHVWDELDAVREVWFDWMTERLSNNRHDTVDTAIVQTIGSLAQHDFHSVRHRILDPWLLPPKDIRAVFLSANVFASAAENDANTQQIRDFLAQLAKPRMRSRTRQFDSKFAAVVIGMGRLALRRPEITIDVMKLIGRELFGDQVLRVAARRSPALYGHKDQSDGETLTDLRLTEDSPEPEETSSPEDESDIVGLDIDNDTAVDPSRAVPAAIFLAAIADWANENASDKAALLKRQVPLSALLQALYGMPLLSTDDSTRLTLQDLIIQIAARDTSILDRIVVGMSRAGAAKMIAGYLPRRDMQMVFKSFAHERAMLLKKGTHIPQPDPYLSFAGVVFTALKSKIPEHANLVITGSGRWISESDAAIIQAGGPLPGWLERNKYEVD